MRRILVPFVLLAALVVPFSVRAATSTDAILPSANSGALQIDTEQNTGDQGNSTAADGTYESAIVQDVKTVDQQVPNGATHQQAFDIEYLSGPLNGKTRTISNDARTNPNGLQPAKGDKVVVYLQPDTSGGEPHPIMESFDRRDAVYCLIALFFLTMLLLAGWKGFRIASSVILSLLLIALILIPAFLKGMNPVPIAALLAVLITTINSLISMGRTRKCFVTVIGTLGGVLAAYLLSVLFANWAHLSGIAAQEDHLFFDKNPLLDPHGLLFAGIMIAALGVVQDIAVSIASGVMEIKKTDTRLTFKDLFCAGMIVGRDRLGTLANVLVFVAVGGSLSTLLLYSQYGGSWMRFINVDPVANEIVRSLAGTIGLVFSVPITALLAAWIALRIKGHIDPIREATTWHGEHTQM